MELKDTIHNFLEGAVIGLGSKSLSEFLTAFQSDNIENEFGEEHEQYRD